MRATALLVTSLGLIACGGSSQTPALIALSASGASPSTITIPSSATVNFVNHDTADHQIASSCTELASPKLSTSATFTATFGAGPKSCSFSDGLNPSSTVFQGSVTVRAPGAAGGGGGY